MAGVWIFAEKRESGMELLNAAGPLAEALEAPISIFVLGNSDLARDYIRHGADEILALKPLPPDDALDAYIPVIVEAAQDSDPDVFLFSATARGKEMAAKIASHLKTGLCSSCTSLGFNKERNMIIMERLAYGGAAVQKLTIKSRPVMATVPPRIYDPAEPKQGREGTVKELPGPGKSAMRVLERKGRPREAKDISEASRVVCVGRGLEKKEDLALARDLAEALDAEIGCTRPVSEEQHWLPEELCIGLSGIQLKPDLYLGVGVSGQIQHVTGIRNSKIIAAINKDEHAPIFGIADYGIVGDLYDVVPKLISALKKA